MSQTPVKRRRFNHDRRGAVTVEVAVVFPILIFIVFGMVEYINAEFIRQGIAEATFEGCRQGIVRGATAEEVTQATARKVRMLGISSGQIRAEMTDAEVIVQAEISLSGNTFGITKFLPLPNIIGSYRLQREKDVAGGTPVNQMSHTLDL